MNPKPKPPIILLDLNYTLVGNSNRMSFPHTTEKIEAETYRQDLVRAIKDKYVIILTARGEKWKDLTLHNISKLTGWTPNETYFTQPQDRFKKIEVRKSMMLDQVMDEHGQDASLYLAIESNPKSRAMFESRAVLAMPQDKYLKRNTATEIADQGLDN